MLPALYLIAGVLLLWKGGDWLVDGADRFARGRGMPSSLAGVFILGFATSAPELAVSAIAAGEGQAGLASGNVVGSNIANVALILGVAVTIHAVMVDGFIRRVELPIAIVASFAVWFLFRDGEFGRLDGALLLGSFTIYALYAFATAGRRPAPQPHEDPHRPWAELTMAIFGLASLVGGAKLFVLGSSEVARWLGVSEVVIGLTLVAFGTSLPELATTVAAARKGQMELAVGNVVGSNIFNLLLVLGVAGVILPQPDDGGRLFQFDLPLMTGLIVAVGIFSWFGGRLRRWQGILLLTVYVAYLTLVTVQATA